MSGRVAAASCLMALVWAPAQSEDISGAEAGWAAIKRCAAIAEDHARHVCTDETLRSAGLLDAHQAKVAETAKSAEAPNTAEHRERFGLQPPTTPKPSPAEARLEVTLASVQQSGDGKLVLTTTDGAIWRQVESEAIRPAPTQGQVMTISKAALGGFLCESAKRVAFRCFRTR